MISQSNRASSAASGAPRASHFFWIVHDRQPFRRIVRGSVTAEVPNEHQAAVLSTEFETWCLDALIDGVLAEWNGLDLHLHFNNGADRNRTELRWLRGLSDVV